MKKLKEQDKTKIFFYFAAILTVIAIILMFFVDIKVVVTGLLFLLLVIGYTIYREKIGQELLVAFIMALTITSYHFYEYTTPNLYFGKINLFPLVCWTFGLVFLREIYEKVKIKQKFLITSIIYVIILFITEYVGYYLLGIRLSSNYSSLLGLGIIHAPLFMKLFYVFAGPVYLLITNYLKVK
ncbi:MAG: hypothetical protein WC533_02290 [Candidatus Pacearchaeota archaeon]